MERIYLGPIGQMVAMDVPSDGYKHDFVEYGSEHVPLSGLRTKDVLTIRHEYEIGTDGLTPRVLSWLRMLYSEAVPGPLYLRESSEKNLLRIRISSTTGAPVVLPFSLDWTAPGAGDVLTSVVATNKLLPSAIPGEELTPAPARAVSWVSAGSNRVQTDTQITPVLPGEQLCFSAYVQSGTPTLELVPYNAALVAQTPITGTTTVAGTPPRRYVSYTVPTNGTVVAVAAQLRLAAAGTTVTHAWQLESGRLTPSAWELGIGIPKVMFTGNMEGSRHGVGSYTAGTYKFKEL
jgi:hypothetical protein